MEVILLERVAKLGNMGEVVNVKPGFGRNYLIPQKKAMRATQANKAVFEARRATIEAENAARRSEAEAMATPLRDASVTIVRQASEDGKLYGSISTRDIAVGLEEKGLKAERRWIDLSTPIKAIGSYSVELHLHAEVTVKITVDVVRSDTEKHEAA